MSKACHIHFEDTLKQFEAAYQSGDDASVFLATLQSLERRALHEPTPDQRNRLQRCFESRSVHVAPSEKEAGAGIMATPSDTGKRGSVGSHTDGVFAPQGKGASGRKMDGASFR